MHREFGGPNLSPGMMKLQEKMDSAYPSLASQRRSTMLGALLFLALLVYCNTLLNGFVYDDHFQVEQNPYVQSFKYVDKILTTTVWSFQGLEGKTNYYRPVMSLGFLICNKIFQSFPFGFHLVNVLLNCVVVWLVFLTCLTLLRDEVVALVTAAIFVLHPIHTEVVAWIAAVTELEMAVPYLASFIFFLRLDSLPPRERRMSGILMCACFALALLSKEQAVILAVLATIYEHVYRSDRETTGWKTKVYRYGGFWMIATVYLVFRIAVLGALAPVRQHPDVSWPQAFMSGFALVGQYIEKLFWPYPLLAFYVFRKSVALSDPRVLAGIGAGVAAVALFIYLWKHARIYSFWIIWVALTLAPVLNARWMATNVFTERYLYLPSIGFCALLAGGLVFLFRSFTGRVPVLRWTLVAAATVLALLAAGEIVARNRDWRDDFTLLSRTLAVEPHASYMRTDFGVLEWSLRRTAEAEHEWRLAIADMPDNAFALSNLGLAMLEKKRYQDAETYLQKAIALRPRFAAPHIHLGGVYAAEGNKARAEAEFRRAVEIYPLSTQARNALGKFCLDAGNLAEAEVQYRASVEALPNPDAWDQLGDIYLREGAPGKAEEAWHEVIRLSPFDGHAHVSLGNIYLASGREAEADREYRIVLLLDPNSADALQGLRKLNPKEFPTALH
jgi:protein O-mannosyl-transferase